MKKLLILPGLFFFTLLRLTAQEPTLVYDSLLAQKLGADAYGMRSYYFVLLTTGPVVSEDKTLTDSLFSGHMQNIGQMAKDGKLVVAGPFFKNDRNYRGIFILSAKDEAEVNELLQADPAISHGLLAAEITRWYGSAALPVYLETHNKISTAKP